MHSGQGGRLVFPDGYGPLASHIAGGHLESRTAEEAPSACRGLKADGHRGSPQAGSHDARGDSAKGYGRQRRDDPLDRRSSCRL